MDHVISLLNSNGQSIIGLLENKLSTDKIPKFWQKLDKNWDSMHNNEHGSKGRILLLKLTWSIYTIK